MRRKGIRRRKIERKSNMREGLHELEMNQDESPNRIDPPEPVLHFNYIQ
jgi:hypothetical protein